MAQFPSSSSSSFTYAFNYDVFLSFRGIDTRFGFIGNLHKALCDKGIRTFIDDEDLERGDEITPTLIKAIQESRIAIPIFSVNYASSSFCLDELVTIIECVKAKGRLVFPIFYDVDPSHVRYQKETYAKALATHEEKFRGNKEKLKENMERLEKWKTALSQTANLSGLHFKPGNGYEHEFIGKILKEVSHTQSRIPLHVAAYPIGLESRVQEIMPLLDLGSGDTVHMVGIYGIGGMGKTTLVNAVFNFIGDQFESLCFLHNVRENSTNYGIQHLQEIFLLKTIGLKIKLGDVSEGISIIKQRLSRKKVLLILDDVDNLKQLRSLVGEPNWFGSGSRVIITTRNKDLLSSHGVEKFFEMFKLSTEEALKLLSWNAFKNNEIDPCYENVLNKAVDYASGLPLALEVIGSNLYGKNIQEWESALEQYEKIPLIKIQQVLKVSYDALEEGEKSVFLDIACCFKGYRLEYVESILNAHHGQCIKNQIGVLVGKSLIKITDIVTQHDLIEDMGKEIVRQESPNDPGNRSRLWSQEDIFEVLENNTGTNKIEMIYLDSLPYDEEMNWDEESFKEMKKLKTLIVREIFFSKGPKHLPNSLRVLDWCNYRAECLPSDFHPKKLSICELFCSTSLVSLELISSSKSFMSLKVLNVNCCFDLTRLPDLSNLPNLEEFRFFCCINLTTIDHSVWSSNKLKVLDAQGCNQLRKVPPLNLPSLTKLGFGDCSSLESFPEILEKMENVTKLSLDSTIMAELPSSFGNLTRLEELTVCGWQPSRILAMLSQLTHLKIRCSGTLEIEEEMSSMAVLESSKVEYLKLVNPSHGHLALLPSFFPNLKVLELEGDTFTIVPECIKQCRILRTLELYKCKQLQEIEWSPPNLHAAGCSSLSLSSRSMLLKKELHEAGDTWFEFPSPETGRIPEWFEHQSSMDTWSIMGPSLCFWFRNGFPHNIILCFLAPQKVEVIAFLFYEVGIIFNDDILHTVEAYVGHTVLISGRVLLRNFCNEVKEAILEKEWTRAEVKGFDGMRIGIHVLLKENSGMEEEDIRFTNPNPENDSDVDSSRALMEDDSSKVEEGDDDSSNYETPRSDFSSDEEGIQGDEFSIGFK